MTNMTRRKACSLHVFVLFFVTFISLASCYEVYLDTHCHGVDSAQSPEDENIWTPDEAIDWHRSNGYNAMILTNHMEFDLLSPVRMYELNHKYDDFRVLPGREWWCNNFHLVVIFNPDTYPLIYPLLLANENVGVSPNIHNFNWCVDEPSLLEILQGMHLYDSLVVLAHPHLKPNDCPLKPSFAQWMNWTLDYVERITSSVPDVLNADEEDAAGFGHRLLAGTDGHNKLKVVPGAYTRISIPAGVEFTDSAIWQELVLNRFIENGTGRVWVEYDVSRISSSYLWILGVLGSVVLLVTGGAGTAGYCCYRRFKTLVEAQRTKDAKNKPTLSGAGTSLASQIAMGVLNRQQPHQHQPAPSASLVLAPTPPTGHTPMSSTA